MKIFDWNKISSRKKKLLREEKTIFILGPVHISKKRIKDICKLYKGNILFGCLKDTEIPGLEDSLHFKLLLEEDLIQGLKRVKKANLLKHFHKDTKYIIKELEPKKVIFINGSWSGPLHYRSMYWKAIDRKAEVDIISAFVGEEEAREYQKKIYKERIKPGELYSKRKKYADKELLVLAQKLSCYSWDWIGQIAAVLAKKGKVLALAWNRVLPYEAFQMYDGAPRGRMQIPSQEKLETQLTNHAESEILETCRRECINMKDTFLYINIFPCPICAKNLSQTDIKGIIYSHDHNLSNDIGYKILEAEGKILKRIVI